MYVVGSIASSTNLVIQSDFRPECQEALLMSDGPKGLLLQCAYEVSYDGSVDPFLCLQPILISSRSSMTNRYDDWDLRIIYQSYRVGNVTGVL
jgi:hypothetical protein